MKYHDREPNELYLNEDREGKLARRDMTETQAFTSCDHASINRYGRCLDCRETIEP